MDYEDMETFAAGLDHYDFDERRRMAELPPDPWPVHAMPIPFMERRGKTNPPSRWEKLDNWRGALCGAPVKIRMPQRFDTDDADACEGCAERALAELPPLPKTFRARSDRDPALEHNPPTDDEELDFEERDAQDRIDHLSIEVAAEKRARHSRYRDAARRRETERGEKM